MEDDLNGRQPQRKTTSRGKTPQGKNTSMEEYLNGSQPHSMEALQEADDISLPSCQFRTEFCPAQPQLVLVFS